MATNKTVSNKFVMDEVTQQTIPVDKTYAWFPMLEPYQPYTL